MRKFVLAFYVLLVLACTSNKQQPNEDSTLPLVDVATYQAQKINSQWVPDQNTLQELLALQNTIYNFNMLKEKIQSIDAYNEYGNLINRHINRINHVCSMKGEPLNILKAHLEKVASHIPQLQTHDIEKSEIASNELTEQFKKLQSDFKIDY